MEKHKSDMHSMNGKHYRNLILMAVFSFIAMYILMYAMVNSIENVFNNVNEFFMAGLMAAPMVPIEIMLMKSMYPDQRRNMLAIAISVIVGLAFFFLIRQQGAVTDKQFLRSMIPHHAGAILMCEQAKIQDPEIKDLCKSIISSQQQEIDQMKAKLAELEK
jgi:uncharacterized protein (DUF305 family)